MDADAKQQELYVREAMLLAEESAAAGDRPFGAVLVDEQGNIVERQRNRVGEHADPLAHAEINVIRDHCRRMNVATLHGYALYTNAAPCSMCFSAMVVAGISRLGYGAPREAGTLPDVGIDELVDRSGPKRIDVRGGILRDDAAAQLARLT